MVCVYDFHDLCRRLSPKLYGFMICYRLCPRLSLRGSFGESRCNGIWALTDSRMVECTDSLGCVWLVGKYAQPGEWMLSHDVIASLLICKHCLEHSLRYVYNRVCGL